MPNRWELWAPEEMLRELEAFEDLVGSSFGIKLSEIPAWRELTGQFLDVISGFQRELRDQDARDWSEVGHRALGVFDLAAKANKVSGHPSFSDLRKHFELFLVAAGILQNVPSSPVDQETNKIFELLITLMVMQFALEVQVENPVDSSSGAPNPDVMFRYKGRMVGVACKAAHSRNGKTIADSIRKGVSQIHRAAADTGFVAVSLKNVWENSAVWSQKERGHYTAWDSVEEIDAAIEAFVHELHQEVANELQVEPAWFGKTMPAVVYYLAPTVLIQQANGNLPMTTIRRLVVMPTNADQLAQPDEDVLDLLHRSAQRPFSGDRGVYRVTDRVR